MNNILTKVEELFVMSDKQLLRNRLELLYGTALKMVTSDDESEIAEEIYSYEKENKRRTIQNLKYYSQFDAANIILDYSYISVYLAQKRYTQKKTSKLAMYLHLSYDELMKDAAVKTEMNKKQNLKVVSNTIIDLAYAAGKTNSISLRLNAIVN